MLPYHGLQDLVAEFYRSLIAGSPVPVSVADAIPVVRWTEEVARSADAAHEKDLARVQLSERVPVLVGQIPLEMLDLAVDLQGRRLIGNPAHGGEHVLELY